MQQRTPFYNTESPIKANQMPKEIKSRTAVMSFKPAKYKPNDIGITEFSGAAFNISTARIYEKVVF